MKEHWNRIYGSTPTQELGWYEAVPSPSLELLARCELEYDDPILDIGAGTSTLIDCLIERGFRNIIAADISGSALARLRERLGGKARQVRWIMDDATSPTSLKDLRDIALWHDRALLHFLMEETQREAYLSTLRHVLRPGGYVIVAAFAPSGAKKCSGLDVRNYDQGAFVQFFGKEFDMIEWFEYVHRMPSGAPRPYTYALMRKIAS